jgi:hypothetical protein
VNISLDENETTKRVTPQIQAHTQTRKLILSLERGSMWVMEFNQYTDKRAERGEHHLKSSQFHDLKAKKRAWDNRIYMV